MIIESIQYHDAEVSNLIMPAKRYMSTSRPRTRDGAVLFFAHATGMHKEQWEPIIEKILECENIQEAWSFDWPSHGEGAALNAQVVPLYDPIGVATWDWGRLIAGFYKEQGFDLRRTFAIGHSGGCTALIHSTKAFPIDSPPYRAMIHIEPSMISREAFAANADYMKKAMSVLHRSITKRRERWPSREDAKLWMSKRAPWRDWDPRVLALFVGHCLGPTSEGKEVCLVCSGAQEATAYLNAETHFQAIDQYRSYGPNMPVHFVFGERVTMIPKFQQDSIVDVARAGRPPTSVHKIRDAPHLVIQEQPDKIGELIVLLLEQYFGPTPSLLTTAKL